MSWTAVRQRACEAAAMSGTVRGTADSFRTGAGDPARQYRENASFPCGRDPRVPPRNSGGSTKSSLAWRITTTAKWRSEEFLPRTLDHQRHWLEVHRPGRQTVDPDHAPDKWDIANPQRPARFAPKHGEADSIMAQPLSTSKHETPACGLAGSSHSNACAGRNLGDLKRKFS